MTNDNRTNLKASHGAHSTSQPQKRGNRSVIGFISIMACLLMLLLIASCQPVNAKPIATDDSSGYYIDLSNSTSGQASRDFLAFFVPDNSAASQAVTMPSSTALRAHLSVSRGQTIISIANHLLTDYDGLTLQNKIAVRRICGAVSCRTESKTRHPILLPYSVAFTQKLQGAIHHG